MTIILDIEEINRILSEYVQANYGYEDKITKFNWRYSEPDSIEFIIKPKNLPNELGK